MNLRISIEHCPLTIAGFVDAGFSVEGLVEPTVTEEKLKLYPELDDELRVPNFIIYILRKPYAGKIEPLR